MDPSPNMVDQHLPSHLGSKSMPNLTQLEQQALQAYNNQTQSNKSNNNYNYHSGESLSSASSPTPSRDPSPTHQPRRATTNSADTVSRLSRVTPEVVDRPRYVSVLIYIILLFYYTKKKMGQKYIKISICLFYYLHQKNKKNGAKIYQKMDQMTSAFHFC